MPALCLLLMWLAQVLPVKKPAQVLPASHIRARVALPQELCQATRLRTSRFTVGAHLMRDTDSNPNSSAAG